MSTALVVSGGGCKGAFASGAADVLVNEAGIRFDTVSGTSTGGLLVPFVAAGEVEEAIRLYTSVHTEDILVKRSLAEVVGGTSLASFKPLVGQVRAALEGGRGRRILDAGVQFFLATTRLQDRRAVFFHNGDAPADAGDLVFERVPDEEALVRAMVASASIPGIVNPVVIDGKQYVDGGVREMTPLAVPVAMGAERIYVILLSPQDSPAVDTDFDSIFSIMGRTADCLLTDISRSDLDPVGWGGRLKAFFDAATERIAQATDLSPEDARALLEASDPRLGRLAAAEFTVIGPAAPLIDDSMRFEPDEMKAMVELGRRTAREVLARENGGG